MLKPPSQVTANLIAAKALIADEENWCQGRYERSGRYCAEGALAAVLKSDPSKTHDRILESQILNDAAWKLAGTPTVFLNDTLGHAFVMLMYDLAIQMSMADA